MSNEFDVESLTPEEREALRWVGSVPVPVASPEARERARAAFLTGSSKTARRPVPLRTLAPLAVAASLLALFWFGSSPSDTWTVLSATDAGLEGGRGLDDGDTFTFGTVVASERGELDVRLGDYLRVLAPVGATVELPPGPGRWFGKSHLLRVSKGEIYATTGGRKLDFELVVESPDTRTRILGTTFAVRCNDLGTCVCLYEGRIETVSSDGVHTVDVPSGRRVQFYQAGIEPSVQELSQEETDLLENLRANGVRGD